MENFLFRIILHFIQLLYFLFVFNIFPEYLAKVSLHISESEFQHVFSYPFDRCIVCSKQHHPAVAQKKGNNKETAVFINNILIKIELSRICRHA